ncbi:hypothetical protein AB0H45_00085 [Streptomyces atroolivaceus]|uniref:hypothetical protein n=1 Tax=Streptomyces atroolivaceus TaxID=66869 RepID=UPI0033CC7125
MSDDKQPELTPAEQLKQDEGRVQGQLIVTDVNRVVQGVMEVFGGSGPAGRTSFEGHELNAMIDLIENSKPEDLEAAGKALWNARGAIKDAAGELGRFIEGVDWEGESGTAFRDWGMALVAHADKLAVFAEVAGTQITVAGTGLASVRNSLPPRDNRLVRKSPDEIETPKRIEGNAEYEAAVKVEKDRQEAINQANRLASYYAVSEETLAAQQPPRFEKKLDVAVPRPQGYDAPSQTENSPEGSRAAGSEGSGSVTGHAVAASQDSVANGRGYDAPAVMAPVPEKSTSTEINSVATPLSPVTAPNTPTPAPITSSAPGGGPTPPLATGFLNPLKSSSRGPQGAPVPRAVGQAGPGGARTGGPAGSGPTANGRTAGSPVGRPAPMGGGSASGPVGRGGGGPQTPTAGRPAVTGGRPMAAGHAASTSGATGSRAGRASGIVGGTPQRAVPGVGTPSGARGVPRGTVIGAGGATRTGSPASTVGQRGVVGAGGTASASRPGGRGTPSTKGVVGTPRGGAGSGGGTKGFTVGGAGLVRGPAGRKASGDEDQDDGTPRPDYLTEDRETWQAGRRGAAPPVIE